MVSAIQLGGPYIGLVRTVDRVARRHVYGLGELPTGAVTGELGGLASRPPRGAIPVWQSHDGRIVTPMYDATMTRGRPVAALAAVVEPIRWSRYGRAVRARATLRRVLELPSARHRARPIAEGPPSGYLFRDAEPGTRPLTSALHPLNGDQLLTTAADEPDALGYVEPFVLGHLRAAAPVTGILGPKPGDVPWAREFGRGYQPKGGLLAGMIELPSPGAEALEETLRVAGWAIGIADRVSRVDVLIDGKPVGRARLGLPRGDLMTHPPVAGLPDAILAGFEFVPRRRDLPAGGGAVAISAIVTTLAGETLVLEASDVQLVRGASPAGPGRGYVGDAPEMWRPNRHGSESRGLLAFTHRLDHGGAQRYFVDQVLRLRRGEFEKCTVVAFGDGPWRKPLEASGVEVHITSSYPRTGPAEYEGRLEELGAWCEPHGHSVAFINTLDCFVGADLAKRLGLPVVWALHESFDLAAWWGIGHGWSADHAYVLQRLENALASADATIFAAEATRRLFEPYVDPGGAVTLPYGVELADLDDFRADFDVERERRARGLRAEAKIVLCLAILGPRKAQALLTQAFATIADDHPDAELLLVGETPGPYSDAIREYVAAMSLSSRVRTVAATPDAYAWHLLADVFALASDIESMPISLLEAMAFEKPALASRVFGVPELIEEGRTGFMFEPNDVGGLASALDRVLRMDPAQLHSVARAGAEHVRERHDPDRYGDRLAHLLRSLEGRPTLAGRS
jgi:D-inositol-3-phosphate glycosyltransferase